MNLLLFAQNELRGDRLRLTDRRAAHIHDVLRAGPGDTLRVGMIGGKVGTGKITVLGPAMVELQVRLHSPPPAKSGLELILALPRPVMLRRILRQATVLGVSGFHLIRSRRVEKSYFQTPLLEPEKLRSLLLDGLSQAMDTVLPPVHVHTRFRPFVEDVLPGLTGSGLLAHPGAGDSLVRAWNRRKERLHVLLAVGPEGGWNDFEVEAFGRAGFVPFSMGSRILHVDTAVTALLAQVHLLRDLESR